MNEKHVVLVWVKSRKEAPQRHLVRYEIEYKGVTFSSSAFTSFSTLDLHVSIINTIGVLSLDLKQMRPSKHSRRP